MLMVHGPNQLEHDQAAPAVDTEPDPPDQFKKSQSSYGGQYGNRAGEPAAEAVAKAAAAALDMIRQENEQHARILQHLADATSNGSLERALQELPAEEDQEYFDPIKKRRRMTLEIQLTTKDDFLRQHDDDPLEAQQYVLPLASARAHSSRVEALPSAFTERTLCRCAWFPRCNKRVWDCGGIRKTSCHRIRGGYETPSGEVFKRRRKEALFTDRAERR